MSCIYSFYFLLLICCTIKLTLSDDILGCGGFIKSHIPIEFSKIEIGLYTKQGTLKDVTDCAPNNGYYFLPLYDHGDYVLKVSAPTGWNLEPSEFALTVDGETDPCSLGQDINFVFVGFAVSGKVVSEGSADGPAGVKVVLLTDKGTEPLLQVTTGPEGVYVFPRVAPGNYELRASHPQLIFASDRANVIVSPDSHKIVGKLSVAGYPVSGLVTSEKEPIAGVSFMLHGEKGKKFATPHGCLPSPQGLCRAESGPDGRFVFPALAPGQYHVVPHYAVGKEGSAFDVRPREMRFTVEHGAVLLTPEFQVKGFTVTGRVLTASDGAGVADAKVLLNSVQRALTGHDGAYRLDNMQAGTYTLSAQADSMQFSALEIRVSPASPGLPDLVASGLAVCGSVAQGTSPSGTPTGSRKVTAVRLPQRDPTFSASTEERSGTYCLMLPAGEYQVYVHVSDTEIRRGLRFAPPTRQVIVKDAPVKNIDFSPLRATLEGRVKCLQEPCPAELAVVLTALHSEQPPATQAVSPDGSYTFSKVLPGQYEVTVKSAQPLCWEKQTRPFTVSAAKSQSPDLVQTGYSMALQSTHPTTIEYFNLDNDKVGSVEAPRGASSWCVPGPGPYMLVPSGCHEFATPWYSWELGKGPVNLLALKHTVGGSVLSPEQFGDITVLVTREDGSTATLGPLQARPAPEEKGMLEYQFQLVSPPGERLRLEPRSDKLLFSPTFSEVTTGIECQLRAALFKGDKGHFVEGKVNPPLEGVHITIMQSGKVVQTTTTNKKGEYVVGPLPTPAAGQAYAVEAQLEGYQVLRAEADKNSFSAKKLAQVVVRVQDVEGGAPLGGVLLSLSGGEYRRNSQVGADGSLTFHSLWPGDYFLRPKLKEYRFEPQSKMITVTEGSSVEVQVTGRRVAFSCMGTVSSLSGEPEDEMSLEAVGIGEKCKDQQEETVSEPSGQFRIRGLVPHCAYVIRLKQGAEANKHISRISPSNLKVQADGRDVTGLQVIAMRPPQHTDVAVLVVSASPGPLLRLRLFRESEPDSPLLERKLEPAHLPQHYTVLPALPSDGKAYYIQVDSVSSPQQHREVESKVVHFVTNSSLVNLRVEIRDGSSKAEQSTGDGGSSKVEGESRYGSLLLLSLVIGAVSLVVLYHAQLAPLVTYLGGTVQGLLASAPSAPASAPTPLALNEDLFVEPVTKRKPKPRKT